MRNYGSLNISSKSQNMGVGDKASLYEVREVIIPGLGSKEAPGVQVSQFRNLSWMETV